MSLILFLWVRHNSSVLSLLRQFWSFFHYLGQPSQGLDSAEFTTLAPFEATFAAILAVNQPAVALHSLDSARSKSSLLATSLLSLSTPVVEPVSSLLMASSLYASSVAVSQDSLTAIISAAQILFPALTSSSGSAIQILRDRLACQTKHFSRLDKLFIKSEAKLKAVQ